MAAQRCTKRQSEILAWSYRAHSTKEVMIDDYYHPASLAVFNLLVDYWELILLAHSDGLDVR